MAGLAQIDILDEHTCPTVVTLFICPVPGSMGRSCTRFPGPQLRTCRISTCFRIDPETVCLQVISEEVSERDQAIVTRSDQPVASLKLHASL